MYRRRCTHPSNVQSNGQSINYPRSATCTRRSETAAERDRERERDEGNPSAASPRLCAFQGRAKCTLDLVFNPSQSRATNELNEQQRQRERERERETERDIDEQTARDMS